MNLKECAELKEKVLKYEKALCAMLNLAANTEQDILIDIISDTLLGYELMERYKDDFLEGTNLLAQIINCNS